MNKNIRKKTKQKQNQKKKTKQNKKNVGNFCLVYVYFAKNKKKNKQILL